MRRKERTRFSSGRCEGAKVRPDTRIHPCAPICVLLLVRRILLYALLILLHLLSVQMRVIVKVQVHPDTPQPSSTIEISSQTTEPCDVLHGLQHRPCATASSNQRHCSSTSPPTMLRFEPLRRCFSTLSLEKSIRLTSLLIFSTVVVPYLKYSRQDRSHFYDSCNLLAFKHYQTDLARCTEKLADEGTRGDTPFARSWLGIGLLLLAAVMWQYMTSLLQEWLSAKAFRSKLATDPSQAAAVPR